MAYRKFKATVWNFFKGQAIPKGLHVRMNIQTGDLEAKLMEEDNTDAPLNPGNGIHLNIDTSQGKAKRVICLHVEPVSCQ